MNVRRTSLVLSLLLVLVGVVGCGSPLVGLECREGFSRCSGGCYDLRSDEAHCGGCDISCAVGEQCIASACMFDPSRGDGGADGGDIEGGVGDAGMDGSVPGDAGMDAASDANLPRDAQADGAGSDTDSSVPPPPPRCSGPGSPEDCVCDLGQLECDLVCVNPSTDRNHCGGCGVVCAMDQYCAAGMCAPRCEAPLSLCDDTCVDLLANDRYCGGCQTACGVGAACIDGECVGRAVGHVVVIGHDMSAVRAPMQTLVGNAVFLARTSPVRVLVYDAATTEASRLGVTTAIDVMSQTLGRPYRLTTAMTELVGLQLGSADVFVIDVQQGATDDALFALGESWSLAFDTFLFRGGVILLFDAGGGNAGTYQILTGAGLLGPASSRTAVPRSRLRLVTPSDAIGAGIPTEYQSEGESAIFELDPATEKTVVVGDPMMSLLPVVFHIAKVE